jgi:hypothetical protein
VPGRIHVLAFVTKWTVHDARPLPPKDFAISEQAVNTNIIMQRETIPGRNFGLYRSPGSPNMAVVRTRLSLLSPQFSQFGFATKASNRIRRLDAEFPNLLADQRGPAIYPHPARDVNKELPSHPGQQCWYTAASLAHAAWGQVDPR